MLRAFVFFQFFVSLLLACKCKVAPWKETFEEAKWVSHLKINNRKVMPDRRSLVYDAHHIDIFKKDGNVSEKIVTLASSSGCGVPDLKVGQEYLVAGTIANGDEPRLISCLMFVQKNTPDSLMGALEWDNVPPELLKMIKSGDFEKNS
ncbi:hypothetical protein M3Y97_00107300 [Aphelenchoides bicaudatus]|nr:hypothetical protein M3Y97_00107300 [Aphelenchoides bicaudatus]